MKLLAASLFVFFLVGCAESPRIGITISNSPESIESCGARAGGCR